MSFDKRAPSRTTPETERLLAPIGRNPFVIASIGRIKRWFVLR
jgi:hypothetical protein